MVKIYLPNLGKAYSAPLGLDHMAVKSVGTRVHSVSVRGAENIYIVHD